MDEPAPTPPFIEDETGERHGPPFHCTVCFRSLFSIVDQGRMTVGICSDHPKAGYFASNVMLIERPK